MSIIAIIPARGGSKSLYKKNIKLLRGIPLIGYAIRVAEKSNLFDKIIISTDCEEIKNVSEQFGASVIMRPAEYALDTSPTEDALIHVLDTLQADEGYEPSVVCTLEPTSPLREVSTLQRACQHFFELGCDSLLTVTEERSAYWIKNNNDFTTLFKDQPRRRQERQPIYKEAGVVYLSKTSMLKKHRKVICGNVTPFEVSHEEAIDINDEIDFLIAESILANK